MARRPRKRVAKRPTRRRGAASARQENRAVPSFPKRLHNLPTQLTTFIGREQEIAEIKRLLATTRLLTLTGSGGCGKTRLALQVAADGLDSYPDGAWLVEFAPVTDPALVPKTVAAALGVPERPGRDMIETLVDALRPKALLLVLDNCEHLLAACGDLAVALLRACPQVRILATSREGLAVPGESLWRVPSLSLPDARRPPPPEDLVLYDAVRLFVDRAIATAPGFAVTSENARAVAQICKRLDGIPLAIELAAARVKALALEQIAARLDDRFRLLTGGSRTAVLRQQTLRAAMDWSYHLLTATERVLLRRLAVFAGGWTLEAAEAVCAGGSVEASSTLDVLTFLVDKSLVLAETQHGEARYRLLETVRQYGGDRLEESGESGDLKRRHRDWFVALAEQAEPRLRGPEQQVWLDRLEAEHDNLRDALTWSTTDPSRPVEGLRLATALYSFWTFRGHWSEARRWYEATAPAMGEALSHARAKGVSAAAFMTLWQGDYGRATALARQGLTASRKLRDVEGVVRCREVLGHVAVHSGDYRKALRLFQDNVDLCRKLNDEWLLARELGNLQFVVRDQGDYGQAAALCSESLALFRKIGDKHHTAWALRNFGLVALRRNDPRDSTEFCRDSLALSKEIGNIWLIEQSVMGLAGAEALEGRHEQATRLFAAAEAIRESLGRHRSAADQADYDKRVASTRAKLGDTIFTAAWKQGAAMTLEEAVETALAPKASLPAESADKTVGASPFTPREREVVELVAQGLSNRQIASRLVISERTVDTHVQHILNKLGVDSRVQVTAWAVEQGLHTLSPS